MQHCGKSRSMDFRLWPIKGTKGQDRFCINCLEAPKPYILQWRHNTWLVTRAAIAQDVGHQSNEGLVVRSLAAPVCIPLYSSSYAMTCFGQLVLLCGDMTLESFSFLHWKLSSVNVKLTVRARTGDPELPLCYAAGRLVGAADHALSISSSLPICFYITATSH